MIETGPKANRDLAVRLSEAKAITAYEMYTLLDAAERIETLTRCQDTLEKRQAEYYRKHRMLHRLMRR